MKDIKPKTIIIIGIVICIIIISFSCWHDYNYKCIYGHYEIGANMRDRVFEEKRFVCDCYVKIQKKLN